MKIIITAGGTSEPIDAVRTITNKSSGNLGRRIAIECLFQFPDCELYYLHGKNAEPIDSINENVKNITIESTDDLLNTITQLLTSEPIDLFIHSMAVSDYTTDTVIDTDLLKRMIMKNHQFLNEYTLNECFKLAAVDNTSKVSSNANIMINLKQTPKIIKRIKELSPYTFLVGFKLLNDVSEQELFDVGFDLLRKNRCNLVLANDLKTITQDEHKAMLIYPEKVHDKFETKTEIAKNLVTIIYNRIHAAHPHSHYLSEWLPSETQLKRFYQTGKALNKMDLLPKVINHDRPDKIGTYGNLSMRVGDDFIITGRNIDKTNIKENDLVCIKSVDFINQTDGRKYNYATVNYQGSGKKPSIDAAIHAKLYDLYDIGAIIHVHTPDKLFLGVPVVYGQYPCGSEPECKAIAEVLTNNNDRNIIQLEKHGLMIFGDTLRDCQLSLENLLSNRPYIDLSSQITDKECLGHIKTSGADFVDEKESYPIKIKDETIGMIWESTKDINNHVIDFGIYVKNDYQRKGLGIISKYLYMRRNNVMRLHTKTECGVAELYQAKYGFMSLVKKDNGHEILIKT